MKGRGFDHGLGESAQYDCERVAIVERMPFVRMQQKAKQTVTPRLLSLCYQWFHGLKPIFRQLRIRRKT